MSDDQTTWGELRELGRLSFGGQLPGRALEAELVERFEEHPGDLRAAIVKLGDKFKAGRIHSPWPLVLRELDQTPAAVHAVADSGNDLARRLRLAERWIRNAGLYEPSEAELLEALVGEYGPLRAWSDHAEVRSRLVACWEREKPRADRAEAELLERAAKHRRTADAIRAAKAPPVLELEAGP